MSGRFDETFDTDPGPAVQAAAERHLAAVWTAFYASEEADDLDIPSPASAPFCGCETCVVREVLAGAWPTIEAYFALSTSRGAASA